MRFNISFFLGILIGALIVTIPLSYLFGRYTSEGVASDFIIAAQECKIDSNKFKEMLTHVKGGK